MKTRIELPPRSLTPSGTGRESFKLHPLRYKGRRYSLRFFDQEGGEVEIIVDDLTLALLKQELP